MALLKKTGLHKNNQTFTSKVSKMIIWSIQYFGVRARRGAWPRNVVLELHKFAPKWPKFVASDLFPRASSTDGSFEVAQNRTKMSQICRRWFIFTRMYMWILMAVFTNFAATLARQPAAASLAPRSNKLQNTFEWS